MIILVIHVHSIFALEAKRDAPVTTDTDSPGAAALALELMQVEPGQIHILRRLRRMKAAQNQTNAFSVSCLDSGARVTEKESLETAMPECPDHTSTVTQNVTGYNSAGLGRLTIRLSAAPGRRDSCAGKNRDG